MAGRSVIGVIVLLSAALLLAGAVSARADPFYLRYDADEVYPEDAGWERNLYDPGGLAKRSLDAGWLTLDTRGSYAIWDMYYVHSTAFGLRSAEQLRVSWRMQTLETDFVGGWNTDVDVFISNGDSEYVQLFLAPDYVAHTEYGMEEPDHYVALEPGVAHSFLFTSSDMQEFELHVDGTFAFSGVFLWNALAGPNRVSFGDKAIGLRSLSQWDYVEVAVVPEPATLVVSCMLGAPAVLLRRRTVS
ncbi:MAG: hypothetical protein PVJ57_13150 [Phycisphaerae bacterium]|jgi:hypothetical protein